MQLVAEDDGPSTRQLQLSEGFCEDLAHFLELCACAVDLDEARA